MATRSKSGTATKEGKPTKSTRSKQRWPFIRKRVYPNGAIGWLVDSRTKTGGVKKVLPTIAEAETYAQQCRVERDNNGIAAFANTELAAFGKSVHDAIAFYLEHLRKQAKSVPVEQAINELIESRKRSGKSLRYCHDLRLRLGRFQQAFPTSGVAAITAGDLDHWLAGLPVAPGTRNTFRRDLRTLFSFSIRRGYITENPASGTEIAKDVDKAPGILSVEESARLLEACTTDLLPYVAIGLFAGLRSAELEKLDWSEINLKSNLIEVKAHKAKTARRRLVRIEPALRAWLEPIAQASGPVVPEALRYRFDDAKRAAGFGTPGTETDEERKARVKLKEWPQNGLRHSFGSYWLAKNPDAAALALQMGNSSAMVFQHYRELVTPEQAERFWNLRPASGANNVIGFAAA
jgi:integrase